MNIYRCVSVGYKVNSTGIGVKTTKHAEDLANSKRGTGQKERHADNLAKYICFLIFLCVYLLYIGLLYSLHER